MDIPANTQRWGNPLNCKVTNQPEVFAYLSKIGILIIACSGYTLGWTTPVSVLVAVSGFVYTFLQIKRLPFWEEAGQVAFTCIGLLHSWVGVVGFISTRLTNNTGSTTLFLIFAPIMLVASQLVVSWRYRQVGAFTDQYLSTGDDAYHMMRHQARIFFQWIHDNQSDYVDETEAVGARRNECIADVGDIMLMGVQRFPDDAEFRLNVALFYTTICYNRVMCHRQLQAVRRMEPNFELQYRLSMISDILADATRQNQSREVTNYMEFKLRQKEVQKCTVTTMRYLIQFWTELLEPMPDLDRLATIGHLARSSQNEMMAHYHRLLEINPNSIPVLKMLASVHLEITGEVQRAVQLFEQANVLETEKKMLLMDYNYGELLNIITSVKLDIFDEENGIIGLSLNEESFGIIESVNSSLLKMLGYSQQEDLVGKSVNIIIPEPISYHHDDMLAAYLQSKSSNVVGHVRMVFALHLSGHLVPIVMYVRWADESLGKMIAVLQTLNNPLEVCAIINSSTNHILHASANLPSLFGYSRRDIMSKQVSLLNLVPDLAVDTDTYDITMSKLVSKSGYMYDTSHYITAQPIKVNAYVVKMNRGEEFLFFRATVNQQTTRSGLYDDDEYDHLESGLEHDMDAIPLGTDAFNSTTATNMNMNMNMNMNKSDNDNGSTSARSVASSHHSEYRNSKALPNGIAGIAGEAGEAGRVSNTSPPRSSHYNNNTTTNTPSKLDTLSLQVPHSSLGPTTFSASHNNITTKRQGSTRASPPNPQFSMPELPRTLSHDIPSTRTSQRHNHNQTPNTSGHGDMAAHDDDLIDIDSDIHMLSANTPVPGVTMVPVTQPLLGTHNASRHLLPLPDTDDQQHHLLVDSTTNTNNNNNGSVISNPVGTPRTHRSSIHSLRQSSQQLASARSHTSHTSQHPHPPVTQSQQDHDTASNMSARSKTNASMSPRLNTSMTQSNPNNTNNKNNNNQEGKSKKYQRNLVSATGASSIASSGTRNRRLAKGHKRLLKAIDIDNKHTVQRLQWLTIISFLVLCIAIGLSIVLTVIARDHYDNLQVLRGNIHRSSIRPSILSECMLFFRTFKWVNARQNNYVLSLFHHEMTHGAFDIPTFINYSLDRLDEAVSELHTVTHTIDNTPTSHPQLTHIRNSDVFDMFTLAPPNNHRMMKMNMKTTMAYFLAMFRYGITYTTPTARYDDISYFYVYANGMNGVPDILMQNTHLLVDEVRLENDNFGSIIIGIFAATFGALLLALVVFVRPIVIQVEEAKTEILLIFQAVPYSVRKTLRRKAYSIYKLSNSDDTHMDEKQDGDDDDGKSKANMSEYTSYSQATKYTDVSSQYTELFQKYQLSRHLLQPGVSNANTSVGGGPRATIGANVSQTLATSTGAGVSQHLSARSRAQNIEELVQPGDKTLATGNGDNGTGSAKANQSILSLSLAPASSTDVLHSGKQGSGKTLPTSPEVAESIAKSVSLLDEELTEEEKQKLKEQGQKSMYARKSLINLFARYFVYLVIIASFFVAIYITSASHADTIHDLGVITAYGSERAVHLQFVAVYTMLYISSDYNALLAHPRNLADAHTRGNRNFHEAARHHLQQLRSLHHDTLYGNAERGIVLREMTEAERFILHKDLCGLEMDQIRVYINRFPQHIITNCAKFRDGILAFGLYPSLLVSSETAEELLNPQYHNLISFVDTGLPAPSNEYVDKVFTMFNNLFNGAVEYDGILLRVLTGFHIAAITEAITDADNMFTMLIIIYDILLVLGWLLLLYPTTVALADVSNKTKSMILLLPPDVVRLVHLAQEYIQKHISRE